MNEEDKESILEETSQNDPLNKVPPDFFKAKKHGKANLIYDYTKIKINWDDPNTFCECCNMPYP